MTATGDLVQLARDVTTVSGRTHRAGSLWSVAGAYQDGHGSNLWDLVELTFDNPERIHGIADPSMFEVIND